MERKVGTTSRGIRCPIIREGDDLAKIVVDSVLDAAKSEGFGLNDRDVVAVTESVVARAQGNYAPIDAIAKDVRNKLGGETIGVIFPILSRNRFAVCLRGIARGAKKIVLMLSYPSDEVGNELVSLDKLDEAGVNPYSDVLTEAKYRELFGENRHPFTLVDYVQYYGDLIREEGAEVEIIFANNPRVILNYTKNVLTCDIHSRVRTKRILWAAGAEKVCGLDDPAQALQYFATISYSFTQFTPFYEDLSNGIIPNCKLPCQMDILHKFAPKPPHKNPPHKGGTP